MGGEKIDRKKEGKKYPNSYEFNARTHLVRDFHEGSTIESQSGAEIIENSRNNENKQTVPLKSF